MGLFYGVSGVLAIVSMALNKGYSMNTVVYWTIVLPVSFIWVAIAEKIWS